MNSHWEHKGVVVLGAAFFLVFVTHSMAQSQGVIMSNNRDGASYVLFDAPDVTATYTYTNSINDKGDVAGFSPYNHQGGVRGFVRNHQGNITAFDAPNASFTRPNSINDKGDVAGAFGDNSQGGRTRGFVPDEQGNITAFDLPNSVYTWPSSINGKGNIAGYFSDTTGIHGFVRDPQGNIKVFDAAGTGTDGTYAYSINDKGDVTGAVGKRGFVRDREGSITVFDAPNNDSGYEPHGINEKGDVAGWFLDGTIRYNATVRGFVRDQGGSITVFDAPNTLASTGGTRTYGINDKGEVTGSFFDTAVNMWRGFVRDEQGNITAFDAPNAGETDAFSINDKGDVAGYCNGPTGIHGFVRTANP